MVDVVWSGIRAIGKCVADTARARGMSVMWMEQRVRAPHNDDDTAFDDVLAQSDVLSLHCQYTPHYLNHH